MHANNRNRILALSALALVGITAASFASRLTSPSPDSALSPIRAKIAPYVLEAMEAGKKGIPVIVKLKQQADLSSISKSGLPREERIRLVYDSLRTVALESQSDLASSLEQRGIKHKRFYISNMIAVWEATPDLIAELAAREDVSRVYGNPSFKAAIPTPGESFVGEPLSSESVIGDNVTFSKADQIWAKYGKAGEGIVVAGQDTGVQFDHPALVNQYRGNADGSFSHDYNWHDAIHGATPIGSNNCGYDLKEPCDDGDHGTHTVGTIVGSDGKDNVIGLAPKSQWIACRNMDGGDGTPASYLECFEWLLAPYAYGANPMKDGKPSKAPHIINNSWGCPESEGCSSDEILPALKAMNAAGILVVVSAGNEGMYGCGSIRNTPAWHTDVVISVGAYDHRSDKIAYFSSRGPSRFDGKIGPDLVAPGVNIRSAVTRGRYQGQGWSGTSMAGPHVAGAAALLWSIQPALIGDIERTKEILRASATPKTSTQTCGGVEGTQIPNNTFGMGVLDIEKALELAGATPSKNPAPVPTPSDTKRTPRSLWPKN